MSAPRKIWATHTETEGAIERGIWADTIRQAPEGTLYHHDDAVLELVQAARDVDRWMRGERAYERIGYGTKLRAALAKIAQERSPDP